MTRTLHRRLASFLSLILAVLLYCQGMAQASMTGKLLPSAPAGQAMMSCHTEAATAPSAVDCPDDCLHVAKATASDAVQIPAWDQALLPASFWLPTPVKTESTVGIRSLALSSPTDPPILLRFQRFRE